jgi:lauroyl/myristoyl acyltransferase
VIPSPTVIRTATRLLRVIPVPVARALARAGGTVAWALQGDRRRTLLESLAYTAPERASEHGRLARRTFRNMAMAAVDQFRLPSIKRDDLQSLFEIRGLEHVMEAQARGKGTVIATAHLGPYELAAACLALTGYTVYGMVEDLAPDVLEALASYRSATGMQLVNMKDGLRAAYRVLNGGHILCLVADRAIGDTRGVVEVPFAGGKRRLPTGPVVFAQGTGAALITAFTSLNPGGRARYLIEFDAPLYAEGRSQDERERLMGVVVERISAAVRRNPDQWFVFQPDWIKA